MRISNIAFRRFAVVLVFALSGCATTQILEAIEHAEQLASWLQQKIEEKLQLSALERTR